MLNCCNKSFKASFKFFAVPPQGYKLRQVLFSYCPNKECGCAVYKEILTDYNNIYIHTSQKFGIKAEELYKKACANKLIYFPEIQHGSFEDNNWYFGSFKKTTQKDEKGNPIYLQIKENLNGIKEVLGQAKVTYG